MRQAWRLGWLIAIPALAGLAAWLVLRAPGPAEESDGAGERTVEMVGDGPTLQAGQGAGRASVARGALAIRGRALLSYGKPAVGARVSVSLDKVGAVARATVGADGSYAIAGLAKGLYGIETVWLDGEIEFGARGFVSAGVHDYDMTLTRRPRTVEVRVLTPAGEPVPRFDVQLLLPAGTRSLGVRGEGRLQLEVGLGSSQESVTDLRGACLEIWAARDLDDRSLGLAPQRVGPLAGDERALEVRLVTGPVVEGRVLGPEGPLGEVLPLELSIPEPHGNEQVDVEDILQQMLPGSLGEAGKKLTPAARPVFEGLKTRVKTDTDGAFRIALHGRESPHLLRIEVPEGFLTPRPLSVTAGAPPLEIRLRMATAARITVMGPEGKPRAHASVSAEPRPSGAAESEEAALAARGEYDGMSEWTSTATATTDATGVAVLDGLDPERAYLLRAAPLGHEGGMLSQACGGGRPLEDPHAVLEAHLLPNAGSVMIRNWRPANTVVQLAEAFVLSGIVVDSDNRPVEGALVTLMRVAGEDKGDDDGASETSDDEGRFRFGALKRGVVKVEAQHHRGFMWPQAEQPLLDPPGDVRSPATAPPPALQPHQANVTIAGDVSGVTLRIPKSYMVTLRLAPEPKSVDAKPADLLRGLFGSMLIQILRKNEGGWGLFNMEWIDPTAALLGKDRTTEIPGLEAGIRYAAWMKPHQGRYVYEEFDAKVGSLLLTRREGASITGRVLDLPQGAPHALVSVRDERGLSVDGIKTDAEGRFEIPGLPPGRWTVAAVYEASGLPRLAAEGEAPTGGSVDLRLVVEREHERGAVPRGVR